jgi:hypothetical protein
MTTQEKIKYLKAAEIAFRKEPSLRYFNGGGLCLYFDKIHDLNSDEIKGILGKKYHSYRFTFCGLLSQRAVYEEYPEGREDLKFERADWCKAEIERLEKEL